LILGAFYLSSILRLEVIIISIVGLICGLFGFLRSYPGAIYISLLIAGFLILNYAIQGGDIISIILISTLIVAFYYAQHFLRFASLILQDIKGEENTLSTREVVRRFTFHIMLISTLTVILSFILLNVSVYSSAGFVHVWTVLILAILFIVLASLLIILPREKAI
jgi:hypothetical protein